MGTWRTLHPRRILHAQSAVSVHSGVSPGDSRTRAQRDPYGVNLNLNKVRFENFVFERILEPITL